MYILHTWRMVIPHNMWGPGAFAHHCNNFEIRGGINKKELFFWKNSETLLRSWVEKLGIQNSCILQHKVDVAYLGQPADFYINRVFSIFLAKNILQMWENWLSSFFSPTKVKTCAQWLDLHRSAQYLLQSLFKLQLVRFSFFFAIFDWFLRHP